MTEYTQEEAVFRMNEMGKAGRPFLFIIDYKRERIYVESPEEIAPSELLYDLNGFTNINHECNLRDSSHLISGEPVEWQPSYVSFEEYVHSFETVSRHIHAGNSYLVNLTCATPVYTNLSLKDIFYHSKAMYKLWMRDRFVVFSPEIFVRMRDGLIYSYPMKGTIDATLPDARRRILDDPKEAAEHATIVDLIRNDLSILASEVCVPRYRYIDELRTHNGSLLQVSSEIRGRLPEGWNGHVGEILFSLLPAGSITGAPKKKTLEIIAEAETYERGFYTGVMGYFDGQDLDSAVMIRFMEQVSPHSFVFKSGGGITSKSDVRSEYNEMKRYIDELRTHNGSLLQVSSEIRGRLPEGWNGHVGEILFSLLPAGSITGAPKKKTLEIIAEAETYERGFYTGVMGYFDGQDLDSAVMIRFMEQVSPHSFVFKSGGGITSKSDVRSEYNEMKQKVYVPIY